MIKHIVQKPWQTKAVITQTFLVIYSNCVYIYIMMRNFDFIILTKKIETKHMFHNSHSLKLVILTLP